MLLTPFDPDQLHSSQLPLMQGVVSFMWLSAETFYGNILTEYPYSSPLQSFIQEASGDLFISTTDT